MALASSAGEFRGTLLSVAGYKPGQGTWARGLTFASVVLLALLGWWEWWTYNVSFGWQLRVALPGALAILVAWIGWRLIHYPKFADFLISTEAEMNKVSWPSWKDVKTATVVVLALALLLAAFLFGVDWLWQRILVLINVLQFATRALGDG